MAWFDPLCALAVTMHFHDHGIGHGVFHIWLAADGIKAFLPDTGLDPVAKALEDPLLVIQSSSLHGGIQHKRGILNRP